MLIIPIRFMGGRLYCKISTLEAISCLFLTSGQVDGHGMQPSIAQGVGPKLHISAENPVNTMRIALLASWVSVEDRRKQIF